MEMGKIMPVGRRAIEPLGGPRPKSKARERSDWSFATGSSQSQVRPCPLCAESESKFRPFVTHWVDGAARDVISSF